ncbi:MAG TPA: PAS domain-containing protein [Opitutaceae bacterium]|jgi:PAS domain S-box-containing protein
MGTATPFDEIALKAKVADLTRRLSEAEEALRAAAHQELRADPSDSQQVLLLEARQTLALEHNLLRTVIDIIPDHVFVRDRAGRHLINNQAQLTQLRAGSLGETIGRTDADFYPPGLARKFHEENERVMSTGETMANIEEMIPGPSGEPLWWSTTKVPLRDPAGNVIGLVGTGRNVTDRVEAIQKITEQAAMLDQAHDAIILLTLDGRIAYANPAAEKIHGWEGRKAVGRTFAEAYPPQDVPALREAMAETLAKGSWQGELVIHDRQGEELHLETRRSLVHDEKGRPKAMLSISADITERKKRETLALRAQRMESLGTLAGGIAHDLNNVLAPILMSIALLKLKVEDESGMKLLAMLEKNAERGAQLVRQVLAFGRGAEGRRIPIRPQHIAREIENIVSDTFPKTMSFELIAEAALWTVLGDPTQIHQVLLNLCVNARDAMPNGGRITVHLENVVLDETYSSMNHGSKPGPYVCIIVADTGAGIAPEIRDRIFEPFFTTKEIGKGTGLGLSTSLGIVQGHGGFINLSSDVGKGSTFRIYLPARTGAEEAEPPDPKKAEGLPQGHGELVMVVDDEQPILEVARSTLVKFGYKVVTAPNGAAAVSTYALQRGEIAVVVTDMAMPIMDGPAMIVALKAINPEVQVIGSSGMDGPAGPLAAANAGVREFIPKPYHAVTLLKAIARAISARGAAGEDSE